jgi:bifunctional DNase/RNase
VARFLPCLAMAAALLPASACAHRAPAPQPVPVAVAPARAPGSGENLPQRTPDPEPPVPPGCIEMHVVGVTPDPAVVLADEQETTLVPIYISPDQAMVIELRLARSRYPRPLTHDLFDRLLRETDARLVRVQLGALQQDVFVATLVIRAGDRWIQIDSRASDAIALALGNGVPILVAPAVIQRAGVKRHPASPRLPVTPGPAPPSGGDRI